MPHNQDSLTASRSNRTIWVNDTHSGLNRTAAVKLAPDNADLYYSRGGLLRDAI